MNKMYLADKSEESLSVVQSQSTHLIDSIYQTSLYDQLSLLWRRRGLILSSVVVVMACAFVIISSISPQYTANVLVEINPRQSRVVDFEAVLSGLPADLESIQTELRIIQSRKIAARTITRLKLDRDPELNPALRPVGLIKSWRRSLAEWLIGTGTTSVQGELAHEDGATEEPTGVWSGILIAVADILAPRENVELSVEDRTKRENDRVIDAVLNKLWVTPEDRSRIVRISFTSTNPKRAVDVANSIADFYIVAQLEAKFEATKRATTWLGERVDQLRTEVQAKEGAVEEFRALSGLLQGGTDSTLVSEQVSDLNAQHILELARLAETQARLRQVDNLLKSPGGIESAGEVLQSPLILDLRLEESRVERQLAELAEEFGERHPNMINARAELRDLRAKIALEVDRVVQSLRNEVAIARARSSSLKASLNSVKNKVAKLNQSEVALRALEREANASRSLLENLLHRTKETASQESFQQADANIVSSASMPERPSYPKKGILFSMIFLVALIQGAGLAFVVEHLDLGIRSTEEVEHMMGARPLGLVPSLSRVLTLGKSPQDYVLENPQSAYGEAMRSFYTSVLLTDVKDRPKIILITSTYPGEGKTSLSLALARVLSSVGHRAIVVDCDLRRPTVHKELGIEPGLGLTDCLTEQIRVEELVQEDPKSRAHILQAGTRNNISPDQLDSLQMQRLLKSLARGYDLVILDSAPVLAVSDTLFMARLADKAVFLVRWSVTKRKAASLALNQIQSAGADIAGVLLTMVDVKRHARYGYGDSGAYSGSLKKYYTG